MRSLHPSGYRTADGGQLDHRRGDELAKNDGKLADDLVLRKESLAKLIGLVEKNVINRNTAKKVLAEV